MSLQEKDIDNVPRPDLVPNCIPSSPILDLNWCLDGRDRPRISGEEMAAVFAQRHSEICSRIKRRKATGKRRKPNFPGPKTASPAKPLPGLLIKRRRDYAEKFLNEYLKCAKDLSLNENSIKYVTDNSEKLCTLFKAVNDSKGFYEVTAKGLWGAITSIAKYSDESQARSEYAKHLFHLERYGKLPKAEAKSIPLIDPLLVHGAETIGEMSELPGLLKSTLGVIRKSEHSLDFSPFRINKLKRYVSHFRYRALNAGKAGYVVAPSNRMRYGIDTDFDTLNTDHNRRLHRLEPEQLPENFLVSLKVLPESIQPHSPLDAQGLIHSKANLPAFHLRINQDWQYDGGLNSSGFVTVDLNTGPTSLDWIAIPRDKYNDYKDFIKKDPLDNTEFSKCSLDKLASHKIPIHILTQHQDDVVVVGSGSIVWSNSTGTSSHLTYRLAPCNEIFVDELIRIRHAAREQSMRRTVPTNELIVAILNENKAASESAKKLLLLEVEDILRREEEAVEKLECKECILEHKPKAFCDTCPEELFNHWIQSDGLILCLCCGLKDKAAGHKHCKATSEEHIKDLLKICSSSSGGDKGVLVPELRKFYQSQADGEESEEVSDPDKDIPSPAKF